MSAASAARRTAPDLEVVVCEANGFAAYGMCGIPYYVGGVVPEAEDLLAYPPETFRAERGITLRLHTRAVALDPEAHTVVVQTGGGRETLTYDGLVYAAGARPVRPPIPGLDHERVFTVRALEEAIRLRRLLDGGTVRRALVVGAGYIGLETAEALAENGVEVTIAEALPRPLTTVDEPLSALVETEVRRHATLLLGTAVTGLQADGVGLVATLSDQPDLAVDAVVLPSASAPTASCSPRPGRGTCGGPCWSTTPCARRCPTCTPPVTAWPTTISFWTGRPGCRWALRPTRRGGSRGRWPRGALPVSAASSAPPW